MTPETMDRIINQHFLYEATDDVAGVVSSLADAVEHEVVPSPVGMQTDRARIGSFYRMLFSDLKGESVTPLRRLYGKDFVVDESLWHGRIENGRIFLCDGMSGRVSFRLLHVFELEGEKIRSEQVWCDLAAIQRQLGMAAEAQAWRGQRSSERQPEALADKRVAETRAQREAA
jgi:predicted ester cyclase